MTIRYMCSSWWYLRLQTHTHNMVHVHFMVIPQARDTHSQYGTCAVHGDTSGYRHTLTIWYMYSSWWYLRLQTHTHNMVHVQFMVITQATDTHSQYGTCTVHGDTSDYRHTLTIWCMYSSWWHLRLQTHTYNMVHVQFMLIPQATDAHWQYGTCSVHADT